MLFRLVNGTITFCLMCNLIHLALLMLYYVIYTRGLGLGLGFRLCGLDYNTHCITEFEICPLLEFVGRGLSDIRFEALHGGNRYRLGLRYRITPCVICLYIF